MFAILFANACALTADHAAVDTAAPERPDTGESDTAVATDTDSPTETGDSDTASTPSDTGCDTTERRLRDRDGDGYGEDYTTQLVCDTAAGWSLVGGDCNDGLASINPGTIEVCDGGNVDENCNGLVNDADPSEIPPYQVFKDADGDGYGNVDVTMMVCESPDSSWIGDSTDCDDADPAVYPGHGC